MKRTMSFFLVMLIFLFIGCSNQPAEIKKVGPKICYRDADGDGLGAPGRYLLLEEGEKVPFGYVTNQLDSDDNAYNPP